MAPFVVLGAGTTLYILWALTAYPLEIYVRGNSIVYINQATNNTAVAILYVIATCGSLFFSEVKAMVLFGVANLAILLHQISFVLSFRFQGRENARCQRLTEVTRKPSLELKDFCLRPAQPSSQSWVVCSSRKPDDFRNGAGTGFFKHLQDAGFLPLLGLEETPPVLTDETELPTQRSQPLVGIINAQVQAELRTGSEHPVRFIGTLTD